MTDGVLLQEGDWTLEKMGSFKNATGYTSIRSQYVSLVKHVCYPNGHPYKDVASCRLVHQVVVYPDDNEHCWRCLEAIPNSMLTCWKFQNWEALSYEET
jgi:hypothetical protein